MESQVLENQEEKKQLVSEENNLKVKEAMAVELKETHGLETKVIGRILHLTPGEISFIFSRKAKERDCK